MAKKTLKTAYAAVGALFLTASAMAATPPSPPSDTVRAKVTGTMITENGNCFANLLKPVYQAGGAPPSCINTTVTFKCDGTEKDAAYHKFDIAQKSEITGQVMIVKLGVDPADTAPTAPCFATSVESTILKK